MIEIYYSTSKNPILTKINKAKTGCWINVVDPTDLELQQLSKDHNLELDLMIDATDIYETPRVEQEGGRAYVFARYCYPQGKDIATEPLLIIYSPNKIVTITRIKSSILDRLIDGTEPIATTQKTKTFMQILGAINYSYDKHMYKVNKQILGLRSKLSKSDIKNEYFVEFIDIEENLNEYLTALQPQAVMFRNLLNGRFLPLYEEDKDLVEDLSLNTNELIDLIKSRLKTISNIRDAYSTIMANNLNRIFKRLTSIGIFMAVPTIVASLYGMNVLLPNESSPYAFWEIVGIIGIITVMVVYIFKKLKWL
jgi:magnesium transporter